MDRKAAQKHKIKNNNAIKPSVSCLKLLLETSPKSLHHLSLHRILYKFALSLCVKNEKKTYRRADLRCRKKKEPSIVVKTSQSLGSCALFTACSKYSAAARLDAANASRCSLAETREVLKFKRGVNSARVLI